MEEIEEQVMAAFAAQPAAEEEEELAEEEPEEEEPVEEEPYVNPFEIGLGETRRIDLVDLKFGRNYGRDD